MLTSIVRHAAGNVLSALVWLRPSIIRKNSSAIYLGSLAINDALYLLITLGMSLGGGWLPTHHG